MSPLAEVCLGVGQTGHLGNTFPDKGITRLTSEKEFPPLTQKLNGSMSRSEVTSYSPPFLDVLIPWEAGRHLPATPGVPSVIPTASGSPLTGYRSQQKTLGSQTHEFVSAQAPSMRVIF